MPFPIDKVSLEVWQEGMKGVRDMVSKKLPPPPVEGAREQVIVMPPSGAVMRKSDTLNQMGDDVMTSLAISTAADKAKVLQVISFRARPISEHLNRPIPVRDVVIHKAEGELNGEIAEYVRCVLISPDGEMYAAGSEVLFHHLRRLCKPEWFGAPPWEPPVLVEVRQFKSRNGLTYYTLTPWVE